MTPKWSHQRCFEDASVGHELEPVAFALPVYRLVMAAAASRDFNSIHHNAEYARGTGAPDMYANNTFLQGMWERAVREYIGLAGTIVSLRGFRIKQFCTAGETVTVLAEIARVWRKDGVGHVEITVWSEISAGVAVGPGAVTATLPDRA